MFSRHQRSFLPQQTGTNTEPQPGIMWKERDLGTLSPNGRSPSNLISQSSGNPGHRRSGRKAIEARWNGEHQENRPYKSRKLIWTHGDWISSTGSAWICTRSSAYMLWLLVKWFFWGLLGVQMSGSLIFVPSLGLSFFCWLVLPNFDVIVLVLSYYIIFYYILLLSLRSLF